MRVAITGAGGFIGTHIRRTLQDHVIISRQDRGPAITEKIRGCSAVINLAGAPIIRRWTSGYKRVLWESRIGTTKRLVEALEGLARPVHLISASAIGIYPDQRACDETCPDRAKDFLAELCAAWESEALRYHGPASIIRIGMVLGTEGGALKMMLPIFRLGLGGPIGDGSMTVSWIDIEDLVRAVSFILERKAQGIFNMVSPHPVSNREFTRALARALGRPACLPVPPFMLKVLFGQAAQVLTASKEVYPRALSEAGFGFSYPEIGPCLEHLLKR
jgi:uncharacterized protein (TIGR01777 family)